jgi:hypothetical protein
MNELAQNKKTLVILLIIAVALPVLIFLAQQTQIFRPRATADPIVFTGPNVTPGPSGRRVLRLNNQGQAETNLELSSRLGPPPPANFTPPPSPSRTPSPVPSSSPNPSPSRSPSPSPTL